MPRTLILIFLASLTQLGCETYCRGLHNLTPGTCKKYTDRDAGSGGAQEEGGIAGGAGQPTGGDAPVAPVQTITTTTVAPGFPLTRVTPETYSNNIVAAVNFGHESWPDGSPELRQYDNDTGQTLDFLLLGYGVQLGGVDFATASRRDPTTKGQTLLVSRLLAWELARAAVWKDHEKPDADRKIFTKVAFKTDRPDAGGEEELRFYLQVEELFFRFYARPPTDAEKVAVRAAFDAAVQKELYPPKAWIIIVYALLASQEFWHL